MTAPTGTRVGIARSTAILGLAAALALPARAADTPRRDSAPDALSFAHPDFGILNHFKPPAALGPDVAARLEAELSALGAGAGYYDVRGDRWGTLLLSQPLIPGGGVSNSLDWAAMGGRPADDRELGDAAWGAFRVWLAANETWLRIDPDEVAAKVTVHEGGHLVQIHGQRVVNGVPVRHTFVTAVLNSGNLVLFGTRHWGAVAASTEPSLSSAAAADAIASYVRPAGAAATLRSPSLVLVPLAKGADPDAVAIGDGYRYRLAWATDVTFAGHHGTYETLVDAHSGEMLVFADRNQYADRRVQGGVLPISNDGLAPGGVPDGVEQPGWPMPFAEVLVDGTERLLTDSGGNLSCVQGTVETSLSGPWVRMSDACGAIAESSASGDLDLLFGSGTDCTVPAGSSPGNTHSSRTGFFEVNRIKELARSWLPDNGWLQAQLTANMNIANSCNAFWNGSTINFYRDQGSSCRNTGEIAAVFDHEWGHGMDANDANPGISLPGEAPADIYAMTRLNTSCIGRGFFKNGNCGGNGDPCTECSGVRETDWTKRASGMPHDIAWILRTSASPGVPGVAPPGGCVASDPDAIPVLQTGPCMQGTHCEGSVVSEAVWDLLNRDLRGYAGSPFDLDANTALNLVTRLHYLGGGNVFFWFQCTPTPLGGCNADGGYLNYLAVDDDNGSLLDGTPHMTAIHAAFARHQLACPLPLPANAGCGLTPATPSATVTALDKGAKVEWSDTGASEYWVYRTDGLHGCAFGKERVAIVQGTEYVDTGLRNGREYYYTVEAVGAGASCRSAASPCASVVPQGSASVGLVPGSVSVQPLTGDGDPFLDNCETAEVAFAVHSTGSIPLTNVRIAAVEPISHPEVQVLTPLPAPLAPGLAECGEAAGSFTIEAGGLGFDQTLRLRVDLTADEVYPLVRSVVVEIGGVESDFQPMSSHTFDFEQLGDMEGWQGVTGGFRQLPPGDGSALGVASSTASNDTCDQVRSPLVRLSPQSTLSLSSQFTIEPPLPAFGDAFYDRANVGLHDPATGDRTLIEPSGGRPYNAHGPHGSCVTTGQRGWAGVEAFAPSTWDAAALQAAAFAGRPVRIDVAYGTDPLVSGTGFAFDRVTLTDFDLQVPDAQPDECAPPVCGTIDDAHEAVGYQGGWHRRDHAAASGGGYHRRMGNNSNGTAASVVFVGDAITYHYVMSDIGGAGDVYVDGALVDTVSYGGGGNGKENPTFGHSRTYSGLGPGSHELVVRHRSGAVYVDGFEVGCGGGDVQSPAASGSVTERSAASLSEGLVIKRTVSVGPGDSEVSVVVEGSPVPLTVRLLDGAGNLLATGAGLVSGLTASGVDAVVTSPGVHTIEIVNTAGPVGTLDVSVARTLTR